MTSQDKDIRYGPVVAEVGSKREPGIYYQVRSKNGVLSCNCKGWIFNRDKPKRCKHTELVRTSSDLNKIIQQKQKERKVEPDLALVLLERMMVVAELKWTPVQAEQMAVVLRPHLGTSKQEAFKQKTSEAPVAIGGVRRIVLED